MLRMYILGTILVLSAIIVNIACSVTANVFAGDIESSLEAATNWRLYGIAVAILLAVLVQIIGTQKQSTSNTLSKDTTTELPESTTHPDAPYYYTPEPTTQPRSTQNLAQTTKPNEHTEVRLNNASDGLSAAQRALRKSTENVSKIAEFTRRLNEP